MKFKIGDRVRRIKHYHKSMRPGDTDIVIGVHAYSVDLKHYGNGHSNDSLEAINTSNWKQRLGVK